MTLLAMLLLGSAASAGSAWALGRSGTVVQLGALTGVLALVAIAVLAAASPTPDSLTPDSTGAVPGTLWNGALVPGAYLRLVVALWAATSMLLAGIAWLLSGPAALRGLLPASLASLVGASVTLSAATPALGIVAGGATGLAAIPVILASPRTAATGIAAREVRNAVGTALVLLAVASVAPTLSRLVLADPSGAAGGAGVVAAVSFGLLATAVVIAARLGGIPYHVRVSALTDIVPSSSLPLVVAWLPLPLAAAGVGLVLGVLAPMAPPVGPAQALIVAATLLATLAACLVAFLQDDLRHAVGYLVIADLGLLLLCLAALDPDLWGAARTWLITAAVTKTALAAWAAVAEERFETRSVPDLRGWLRPSPLLGLAFVLIVVATYGLPGWAVMGARVDLAGHAAGDPWSAILVFASFLTLPAYLRWMWVGLGAPTSHVERAAPELEGLIGGRLRARSLTIASPSLAARLARRGRPDVLPVEQETSDRAPVADGLGIPRDVAVPEKTGKGDQVVTEPPSRTVRPKSGVAGGTGSPARRTRPRAMATSRPPQASGSIEAADGTAGPTPQGKSRAAPGPAGAERQIPPVPRGHPDAAARATGAVRRHRTDLLSGAVLALAMLAALVAFGAFDVTSAAGEPTPAVAGIVAPS
jgi:formate hydrogenlyase subunit 3/multisubunit Na+/H+ antiporter MnhD subunit